MTPVLAVVAPDQPLSPHEHEVADWFEAPLGFVLDPANQQRKSALFQGRERHYYEIHVERPEDMGGDRVDDREPGAQAAMELKIDAARWRRRRGVGAAA